MKKLILMLTLLGMNFVSISAFTPDVSGMSTAADIFEKLDNHTASYLDVKLAVASSLLYISEHHVDTIGEEEFRPPNPYMMGEYKYDYKKPDKLMCHMHIYRTGWGSSSLEDRFNSAKCVYKYVLDKAKAHIHPLISDENLTVVLFEDHFELKNCEWEKSREVSLVRWENGKATYQDAFFEE